MKLNMATGILEGTSEEFATLVKNCNGLVKTTKVVEPKTAKRISVKSKQKTRWTEEEKELVREYTDTNNGYISIINARRIAKQIKRSVHAVRGAARKLSVVR